MKTLIKDILLFLVPVILVFAAAEIFYRTVDNNYTLKNEQIYEQADTIETLVMGDSQSFFGINPSYFEDQTFSFANISQSVYFDEILINKHLDSLSNLKTVILPLGVNSLSQKVNTFDEVWRKYFYKAQMHVEVPIISDYDLKNYSLTLTKRFKQTVRTVKKRVLEGTLVGCELNGWANYYRTEESLDLEKTAKYIIGVHSDDNFDFEENLQRLRSIIETCEKRNIKTKIVFMPVSNIYANGINNVKVKAMDDLFINLKKDYKNVDYLNIYNEGSFSDGDFYDANHLNTKGAIKCSKIINDFTIK